jgi:undecaprenyl pyrophosphate synthase
MDEQLLTLAWVSNRSTHQTKFLFELCDNDFDKLLKVEALGKRTFKMYCPADKETVNEWLREWEELREADRKKNKKE